MELLSYLGKVNLYWILFYVCYWLLLRRHTFFQWNRAYLIGSLVISFVLPMLSFAGQATVIEPAVYVAAAIPVYISTPASESYFGHWVELFWAIQALGAALMLSKLFETVQDLLAFIRDGETVHFDNYTLVLLPHSETGSFSFLHWIVINRHDYENHFDVILRHETVHVMQRHSFDILLVELLKMTFWFNPVLWFYKKSFQEVHEFLADEQAPNREHYTRFLVAYALDSPVASLTNHFFNSSLLLTRIKMIYKNRNSQWSLGKYLVVVPIIGVMVLLTSARERLLDAVEKRSTSFSTAVDSVHVEGQIYDESRKPIPGAIIVIKDGTKGTSTDAKGYFQMEGVPQNSRLVISHINYKSHEFKVGEAKSERFDFTLKTEVATIAETVVTSPSPNSNNADQPGNPAPRDTSNIVFTVAELKPEFPGGPSALSQYLSHNIVYPTEAVDNKVQGEVTVSFIVNEKGYVRSPTVVKGLGSGIDEEAVRVVLNMPKWKPGIQNGHNVPFTYTMPIKFDLTSPGKIESDKRQGLFTNPLMPGTMNSLKGTNFTFGASGPLIFVDGVKQKERGNGGMANAKTENIQFISVLKGQSATSMYGEEGKEGVILIQTKKSSGFLQQEPLELPGTGSKKYYKNESKN